VSKWWREMVKAEEQVLWPRAWQALCMSLPRGCHDAPPLSRVPLALQVARLRRSPRSVGLIGDTTHERTPKDQVIEHLQILKRRKTVSFRSLLSCHRFRSSLLVGAMLTGTTMITVRQNRESHCPSPTANPSCRASATHGTVWLFTSHPTASSSTTSSPVRAPPALLPAFSQVAVACVTTANPHLSMVQASCSASCSFPGAR
jgi:hypothetical protein